MGVCSLAVFLVITAVFHPGMCQDPQVTLTVDPPGSRVYVGESVSLSCAVRGGPAGNWTYRWYRHDPPTAAPQTPLHRAAGPRYTIVAARPSDGGPYWCRAESLAPPTLSLPSNGVRLTISETLPATLTIRPNRRQHLWLDHLSQQCPGLEGNSTGWTLKHLSSSGVQSGCLPVGGRVSSERPGACLISSLFSGNAGPYWCESEGGGLRTSTVNISVVYGLMVIQSPVQPVANGESVTLRCLYRSPSVTTFYRDGAEILHSNSTEMTIHNVSSADHGLYKCAGSSGIESPEAWLFVRGVLTTQPNSTTDRQLPTTFPTEAGLWLMVLVPCCIMGVLLIVALSLLAHHRSHVCSPKKGEEPLH